MGKNPKIDSGILVTNSTYSQIKKIEKVTRNSKKNTKHTVLFI